MTASTLLALAAPMTSAPALADDCKYSNDAAANCSMAAQDWLLKNQKNQSSNPDDVNKRVRSFKDTLKECVDCALKKFEKGANEATSDPGTASSAR
jgi:hypothetical protein